MDEMVTIVKQPSENVKIELLEHEMNLTFTYEMERQEKKNLKWILKKMTREEFKNAMLIPTLVALRDVKKNHDNSKTYFPFDIAYLVKNTDAMNLLCRTGRTF